MNLFSSLKITCLIGILSLANLSSCNQTNDNVKQKDEIHLSMDPQHLPSFSQLSGIAKSLRIIPL